MKRYLCIYLPGWSINLAKKKWQQQENSRTDSYRLPRRSVSGDSVPGDNAAFLTDPILLTDMESNQLVVKRFCKKAKNAGVREGMSLALARALIPDAFSFSFDPEDDYRALLILAHWALRFTPLVAVDNELSYAFQKKELKKISHLYHGLILDITGTTRLHKGEYTLASKLLEKFSRTSLNAKIAIAPTIGAAWGFSRYSPMPITILQGTSLKNKLSSLPVAALRIEEKTILALHDIGIYAVSDLFSLPKKSLLTRFGYTLLKRMDEACGFIEESTHAIHSPEAFFAERNFDSPLITHKSLTRALLDLLEDVTTRLKKRKKRAGSFFITLQSLNSDLSIATTTKEISLSAATKDFSHLSSVLCPVIESLSVRGGVQSLRVSAKNTEHPPNYQGDFIHGEEEISLSDSAGELLNNLTVRLGRERVRKVAFCESHIPEKSFSYPLLEAKKTNRDENTSSKLQGIIQDRPPYLFSTPRRINAIALMPDHPPSWIEWKGERYRIIKGVGPERISAEWWHSPIENGPIENNASERDYFKVQDSEGRWLWVFRDQKTQEWFLHGVWV